MYKHLFVLAVGLLLSVAAVAQPTWKTTKATVAFKIKNAGLNVDGTFGGFTGNFLFDPATPEKAQITASVDVNTVDTGNSLRDKHIKKTDYFDVETYPRISLKSTKVEKKGANAYLGTFALTIKKTTRTVMIPFTITQTGTTARFAGEFVIDRKDYDVGGRSLLMGSDVTISIAVQTQSTGPTVATK